MTNTRTSTVTSSLSCSHTIASLSHPQPRKRVPSLDRKRKLASSAVVPREAVPPQSEKLNHARPKPQLRYDIRFQTVKWLIRGVIVLTAYLSLYVYERECSLYLSQVWDVLKSYRLIRHKLFEPILSVFCFFLFISSFSLPDRGISVLSNPKWSIGGVLRTGVPNTLAYMSPLIVHAWLFPTTRVHEPLPPIRSLTAQVAATVALFDILFFLTHYLSHMIPLLFKHMHAKHHTYSPLLPIITLHHTGGDAMLQVGLSILSLNLIWSHPAARALHNIVVIYLLVENHSELDRPWSSHHVLPFFLGGPPAHSHHHRFGTCNFGPFLTLYDRFAGTYRPNLSPRDGFREM